MNGSISMEEAILQLRGADIAGVIAFIIFINWLNSLCRVEPFQVTPPPHMDPLGWLQGSYNQNQPKTGSSGSPTYLQITRSSTMPHQEFVALSKEERRQLSHSNDIELNL